MSIDGSNRSRAKMDPTRFRSNPQRHFVGQFCRMLADNGGQSATIFQIRPLSESLM